MTQEQLITDLVGTSTLDLTVTVKDTIESKITAKFIALTFQNNSEVTMKLEVTTENKDVVLNQHGEIVNMPPITITKMIRADNNTQIPVVDQDNNPVLDSETNNPITIGEHLYWKYLAWENPLSFPFKVLLENVIKVKFNLIPNNLVLQIDLQP